MSLSLSELYERGQCLHDLTYSQSVNIVSNNILYVIAVMCKRARSLGVYQIDIEEDTPPIHVLLFLKKLMLL